MTSFLEEVSSYIYRNHKDHLQDCCIVFPNKRAGLFFRKYLAELINGPVVLPEILTTGDIFTRTAEINQADSFTLIADLYQVYTSLQKSPETFDEFFPWGETLLADFDDVDKYLADAGMLFKNITDLKEIDQHFDFPDEEQRAALTMFWGGIVTSRDSKEKEQFLAFWNLLHPIYERFNSFLLNKKYGYEGMICRHGLEKIRDGSANNLDYTHYFFVGLNALNLCEKRLMEWTKKQGKASFFWDYDILYTQSEHHEAGYFMRENISLFPSPSDFRLPRYFGEQVRDIIILPSSTNSGQARIASWYAGQFLRNCDDPLKSAVVFSDEKFLLPVLHALPASCHEVNITMGYPVEESLAFGFISQVFDLQKNKRIIRNELHFYHKQVLALLHHPFIRKSDPASQTAIIKAINAGNHVMVPAQMLAGNWWSGLFCERPETGEEYSAYLLQVLGWLFKNRKESLEQEEQGFETEVIHRIFIALRQLSGKILDKAIPLSGDTYVRLVKRMLQTMRVAFSGEPLTGLQLLGLLETRVLDFEQVVLFPANEGALPKGNQAPSFIPNNLRFAYGLPTMQHQDAIFAYYFYRLLHRAKKVVILWNSGEKDLTSGRMSRYIYQLIYEGIAPVQQLQVTTHIQTTGSIPYRIEKNAEVLEVLRNYCSQRYLSPTALSDYLSCPLKFYLRHLHRIRPSDEITEDADGGITGSLFHQAAYELYHPYEGQSLTKSQLEHLLENQQAFTSAVSAALRKVVYKSLPDGREPEPQGPYIILRDVILKYLRQLVITDLEKTPFTLLFLEKEFIIQHTFNAGENVFPLRLGGKTDRIDKRGNKIWITDYKTGNGSTSFPAMESLFSNAQADKYKAPFQALYYSMLISDSFPGEGISPSLLFMKDLFTEEKKPLISFGVRNNKVFIEDFRLVQDEFEERLTKTIEEIFDPVVPFSQTEDPQRCRLCDFRLICRR
jgi:hypothetical protein